MNNEEPAWRTRVTVQDAARLMTRDLVSMAEFSAIVEARLAEAEERGRRKAWGTAMEIADECAAHLHQTYESEQANGAYAVLRDLRREER